MRIVFLVILIQPWVIALKAQTRFERYEVESGLSQNTIISLLQDRSGYLWIGTEDGLNRFDGYTFKKFFADANDSVGLANDMIWSLFESSDGRIWIGHGIGISYFDDSGKIRNLPVRAGRPVISIYEDKQKNLWFGTAGNGLIKVYPESLEVEYFFNDFEALPPYEPSSWKIASNNILSISEFGDNLLIGTRGAGLFALSSGTFHRAGEKATGDFFFLNDIWSIVTDHLGRIYIGSSKGLCVAESGFKSFRYFKSDGRPQSLSYERISRLLLDGHDGLWIATYGGGLNYFDFKTETFASYRYRESDPRGLASDLIFSLLKDRSNNLWVGTWGGGLHKLSKYHKQINNFDKRNGLSDFVLGVAVSRDTVFVASYAGGVFYSVLPHLSHGIPFVSLPMPRDAYVVTLDAGRRYLWAGLEGGGVMFTNKNLKAPQWRFIRRIAGNPNTLNNHLVEVVKEDAYHSLWIGTRGNGLKRLNYDQPYGSAGCIVNYESDENDSTTILDNQVTCLFIDRSDYLWVGTSSGLSRTVEKINDEISNQFLRYPMGRVTTINSNEPGKLLVGTDRGLFTIRDRSWVPFDQFKNQFVNAIIWDQDSVLWVSTNNGLFTVSDDGSTRHLTASEGLQSNEFNTRAAAVAGSGLLMFGGVKGLSVIRPDILKYVSAPAAVKINFAKVNNEKIIENPSSLNLKYTDTIIEFDFSLLDYVNPSANTYEYRLKGFEDKWVKTDANKRTATYTNLDAGDYEFLVRARNGEGVLSAGIAKVLIATMPPPWKSWWAYAGYGMIIALGIFLARKTIVTRERMKAKIRLDDLELAKLKELDDFKSKFFANISHEFRTPLTLILGQLSELESDRPANKALIESIRKNGKAALDLVNQLLDLSRVDSGKFVVHPAKIPTEQYFTCLLNPFRVVANQKDIELNIALPRDEFFFADPSVIEKIVGNLVSNAIKYSERGDTITFSATIGDGKLSMAVSDTGIGIDQGDLAKIFDRFYRATEHSGGTGIGLALTKELVQVHKGSITVESVKGAGSTFRVVIPCSQDAYNEFSMQPDWSGFTEIYPSEAGRGQVKEAAYSPDGAPVLLVIEDNEDLVDFLKRNLASQFEIVLARNGEEGLSKAESIIPDVVLCDWMMPRKSGIDVCKALKSNLLTSHVPIILLTAKADTASRVEGLETGADDYITKPFEMKELTVRIANLVSQRKLLREKFSRLGLSGYNHITSPSLDEKFIKRLNKTIETQLSNPNLTVENLAREMGVSRVQLHRKVTALTGQATSDLIRTVRLERAADLLRQNAGNVSEIAYQVGFENLSYFTRAFRQKFKVPPSEYNT